MVWGMQDLGVSCTKLQITYQENKPQFPAFWFRRYLQGTPLQPVWGEFEMKLMREMGYDAATMGNHDFDGGIEGCRR